MLGAPTDEALVRQARKGDRSAFDELVRRHQSRVYAVCLRLTRNPSEAEDALQETFISAYRALPRFEARSQVSTWLYRIATNRSLDVVRRRSADASLDDPDAAWQPAAPGDGFEQHRQRQALEAALRRLPEEFRVAAVLCDVAGLTPTEAGEVLDVPVGTMKSRVFRARAQLAAMLRESEAAAEATGGET